MFIASDDEWVDALVTLANSKSDSWCECVSYLIVLYFTAIVFINLPFSFNFPKSHAFMVAIHARSSFVTLNSMNFVVELLFIPNASIRPKL